MSLEFDELSIVRENPTEEMQSNVIRTCSFYSVTDLAMLRLYTNLLLTFSAKP